MKKFYLLDDNIFYLNSLEVQLLASGSSVISGKHQLGEHYIWQDIIQQQPDIVIMDIVFPDFDGLSLLHRLQVDDFSNNIPVAIYTDLKNKKKQAMSAHKGASYFFIKEDFPPNLLIARFNKIYSR